MKSCMLRLDPCTLCPQDGCGEPWGLSSMKDLPLVIYDGVFNRQCDLFYDREGIHDDNL